MLPPDPPERPLSEKEEWYLRCLKGWIRAKGRPPSIGELASWIRKGRSTTFRALLRLESKGSVQRSEDKNTLRPGSKMRFFPKESS